MAVWGTPVAQEDDAERAVRAALDLVAAVAALGEEVGAPTSQARAGVLTGEAAVTLGAEGQGMVAGDLVNTASRVQSAAGRAGSSRRRHPARHRGRRSCTRTPAPTSSRARPSPSALARPAGHRRAGGGALKSTGLEAPFVGRDRELRLVKDLFHASAEERTAHLVSVGGIAGIGKSRLAWEFAKYVDGLIADVLPGIGAGAWPTGRA